jgi:hypothetical protein
VLRRASWWLHTPDGWRPDARTVGLLVLIGFGVLGFVGLFNSSQLLSIAFTGHAPGVSATLTPYYAPFSVRDRVTDGFVFLSYLLSLTVAIGGCALLTGEVSGAVVVVVGAGTLVPLVAVTLFLLPIRLSAFRVASTVTDAVGLVCLIVVVVWSSGSPTTLVRGLRAVGRAVLSVIRSMGGEPISPEDDAALAEEIETVFPGHTDRAPDE